MTKPENMVPWGDYVVSLDEMARQKRIMGRLRALLFLDWMKERMAEAALPPAAGKKKVER